MEGRKWVLIEQVDFPLDSGASEGEGEKGQRKGKGGGEGMGIW
jgi:uncharacterized spore protein YtfJ